MLPLAVSRLAIGGFLLLTEPLAAQLTIQPIVNTGMPAPGFPQGATLQSLDFVGTRDALNNRGQTFFAGTVTGGGVLATDNQGIWIVGPEGISLVLREGAPATGLPSGVLFSSFFTIFGMGADGSVLVHALLRGADVTNFNDTAVYRIAANGQKALIFREGDPGPGLPAGVGMPTPRQWTMYNDRHLAWHGAASDSSTHVWITDDSGITHIVGRGDAAPGISGSTFSNVNIVPCIGAGTAFGIAGIYGGAGGSGSGFFRYSESSGLQPLARVGQDAVGIPDATFANVNTEFNGGIGEPRALLSATLSGAGITSSNDGVRYRIVDGALVFLIREGDPAPLPGQVTLTNPFSACPASDFAYVATNLTGDGIDLSNNFALVSTDGQSPQVVLLEGQALPGLPDGVLLGNIGAFFNDYAMIANSAGRLAANFSLTDNDGDPLNNSALLMNSPLGVFRAVFRNNDELLCADGQLRRVGGIESAAMNERGELRLSVRFASQEQGVFSVRLGCPGQGCDAVDTDSNCVIDLQDLANLLTEFGGVGGNLSSDSDRDGDVDLQDLANLLAAFGRDCSA